MSKIINGRALAQKIKDEIKNEVRRLKIRPGLATILVGDDPASKIYIREKEKAAQECGFYFEKYKLSKDTFEEKLITLIKKLNKKSNIHGIIVQLPLPSHLEPNKIIPHISPAKDADGFHPKNLRHFKGVLHQHWRGATKGSSRVPLPVPVTPTAIIKLLESTGVDLKNKKAVLLGKSGIFLRPLRYLLKKKGIKTQVIQPQDNQKKRGKSALLQFSLSHFTRQADIFIVALGQPKFIKPSMIKKGAIVIDVGINHLQNGRVVGDVDFKEVVPRCSWITPVPGGVGPMTVVCLLGNVLRAAKDFNFQKPVDKLS